MASQNIKKALKQLMFFLPFVKDMYAQKYKIDVLEAKFERLSFISKIFNYFELFPEEKEKYKFELLNLLDNDKVGTIFPYKQLKKLDDVSVFHDEKRQLYYVIHDGKKLYFPKTWNTDIISLAYKNFIEVENILGGGYREKAPHQYETDSFHIKEGDVLVDAGCAEALFSLNVIEKVSKVYLIESDPFWLEALHATFEPYKDKVQIVTKLLSDKDSNDSISLSTLLQQEKVSSFFIKMDIEGYEVPVIESSKDFLLRDDIELKLACCTYHNHGDAEKLKNIFTSYAYNIEFSDGYMLFSLDELIPPFFRKGVIRACNKSLQH